MDAPIPVRWARSQGVVAAPIIFKKTVIISGLEQASEPRAEGELVGDQGLVTSLEMRQELESHGYGEEDGGKFFLKSFECLYLLYCRRLKLKKSKKTLSFDALMQVCKKRDGEILTKFLIYRDLRSRGYTVKDGFGFGSDFRVYEKGHYGKKGAKYVVFGMNEGTHERIGALQEKVGQITKMGKEPIAAVVERRGEIIYYKVSRIDFATNTEGGQSRIIF